MLRRSTSSTSLTQLVALACLAFTLSCVLPIPAAVSPGAVVANAQSTSGTISGQVFEPSGRPLPNAKVTVSNELNGNIRATVTDDTGTYRVPFLPPGLYTVTVSASGYSDASLAHVRIQLNKLNVVLPPFTLRQSSRPTPATSPTQTTPTATGAEPVEVESLVNSADATRRGNFTERQVESLPLGGATDMRTFDEYALLVAGVAPPPYTPGVRGPGVGFGIGTAGQFSVNGARARSNNFTVDGSDNNDPDVGVRRQAFIALVPQAIESVQEFQISTLLWDAESGRNLGSQVNVVSKGGGAAVHGQAYGFFTDSSLNARNFFDYTGGVSGDENPFTRAQAGIVVGGPLVRDRTQFFGGFEHQDVNASTEHHFATPTLGERSFLSFLARFAPAAPTRFSVLRPRPTFPRNVIFVPDIGIGTTPIGGNVLSLYPLPNNPAGPYGRNTYTEVLPADGDGSVASFKMTHQFKQGTTVSGRYNFTDDNRVLPAINRAIRSTIESSTRTQNLSLIFDTAVGPTLFNHARFSYGRTRLEFPVYPNNPLSFHAESNVIVNGIVFPSQTGSLGELIIEPFSPVGIDDYTFPQGRVNNTFQYSDVTSWTRAGHSLKFGADIRRFQLNSAQDRIYRPLVVYGNGALSLGDFVLTGPNDAPPGRFQAGRPLLFFPGVALATIGLPSSVVQTITLGSPDSTVGLRFTEWNFFFNDNWRVRPNLTLDYGARYEYNTVPREVNNRIEDALKLDNLPDSTGSRFNTPARLAAFNASVDAYRKALDGRERIYEPDRNNVAMHLGFAWSPGAAAKTGVRAGYGIYYDTILGAVVSQSRNVFPNETPANIGLPFDIFNLNNPEFLGTGDPPVFLVRPGSGNQFGGEPRDFAALMGQLFLQGIGGGLAFTLPDKNLRTPYAQQWHLTLERELARDYLVTASYVGTKGTKLTRLTTPNLGPNATTVIPVGFSTRIGTTTLPLPFGPAVDPDASRNLVRLRPTPALGAYQIFENSASSNYHALQMEARKRYNRGYQFTLAYTWSHAIDDVSDVFPVAGAPVVGQDSFDLRLERSNASFDVRHRFSASLIWDLPFYRDSNANGARWLGGWQVATIFQAHSGQPFTLNVPLDANLDGNLTDRPSTTDGLVFSEGHGRQRVGAVPGRDVDEFFSFGSNGFIGRNTVRGDNFINLDLALNKRFVLTETQRLQLRAEFFNLLNRANFGLPIRTIGAPGFGSSVDTANPARIIQFALKYSF